MMVRTGMALGLATMALLSACGDAGSGMQKGFEDGFKTKFIESFSKSCQSGAGGSGLSPDKIVEVCKCTADALIEKHSPSDLISLKPEDAMPVMKECAAKSGLPV